MNITFKNSRLNSFNNVICHIYIAGITAFFMCVPWEAKAGVFCFSMAESFYEQIYCELIAKGKGQLLPPFHEFQRSPEQTQFLLLKRPAARVGITIKAIKFSVTKRDKPAKKSRGAISADTEFRSQGRGYSEFPGCEMVRLSINCPSQSYSLIGNRKNSALNTGALDKSNSMGITNYLAGRQPLSDYLLKNYGRYLDRMIAIGLGGSTMTLAKFERLHENIQTLGIDFAQRMEILYGYLKQDKLSIAVSERLAQPQLGIESCQRIKEALIACGSSGKNYVFVVSNG